MPDDYYRTLSTQAAKLQLIRLLQNAHAGELAAAYAYWGHGHSLFVRDPREKEEILRIYREEIHHRLRLRDMLAALDARPRRLREWGMAMVGATISALCLIGGWFIPMYGAGRLESTNVVEYEVAARLALCAGHREFIAELLFFAEIEWDHENYFYRKTISHPLHAWMPMWTRPSERASIQARFATMTDTPRVDSVEIIGTASSRG